jgi:hypothetical protein
VRRWGSLTVFNVEPGEQKERRECGAPAFSLVLRFWVKRYPVVRILNVPVLLQSVIAVVALLSYLDDRELTHATLGTCVKVLTLLGEGSTEACKLCSGFRVSLSVMVGFQALLSHPERDFFLLRFLHVAQELTELTLEVL